MTTTTTQTTTRRARSHVSGYAIIAPLGSGDLALYGPVVSYHRTLAGAVNRLAVLQTRCARYNGPNTWLDRRLVRVDERGQWRALTEAEREVMS